MQHVSHCTRATALPYVCADRSASWQQSARLPVRGVHLLQHLASGDALSLHSGSSATVFARYS